MSKKKKKKLKLRLMVKDRHKIIDDFVWATEEEIEEYKKQGYVFYNPEGEKK